MQSTIDSTALYMHSLDGFEPSTSEFRAKTGPNEPSRPARNTKRGPNANLMLDQRLRRWHNLKVTLGDCRMVAEQYLPIFPLLLGTRAPYSLKSCCPALLG